MMDPKSQQFNIQQINLKTYNNILRKSIQLSKKNDYEIIFK